MTINGNQGARSSASAEAVVGDTQTDAIDKGRFVDVVHVRRTDGGKDIATYKAYEFGQVAWESRRALLLDTHTPRKAAVVRCVAGGCERASRISAVRPVISL